MFSKKTLSNKTFKLQTLETSKNPFGSVFTQIIFSKKYYFLFFKVFLKQSPIKCFYKKKHYKYFFNITNYFSKFVKFYQIPNFFSKSIFRLKRVSKFTTKHTL